MALCTMKGRANITFREEILPSTKKRKSARPLRWVIHSLRGAGLILPPVRTRRPAASSKASLSAGAPQVLLPFVSRTGTGELVRFLPPGRRSQVVCRRCARRRESADFSWQSCSSGLVASSGEETETVGGDRDRPRELGPEVFDKSTASPMDGG